MTVNIGLYDNTIGYFDALIIGTKNEQQSTLYDFTCSQGIRWQFKGEKTVKDTVFFPLSLKTRKLLLNHNAESSSALL